MTTFWWIRHGPTHARGMVGWTDVPADLSDHVTLNRLDLALPQEAPVISSDLTRAIATADAIAGERPRLPHDSNLRELHFGAWETRRHDEVDAESPDLIRAFWDQPGTVRAPGGESWNDLRTRVDAAVDRLALEHAGGHVIVVAHFGAILSQVQRARGITPREAFAQKIDNLSLTRIAHDGAWHLGEVNHHP
ncbi:MAG: histidine phosphatase family protein [Rhodobacteraceae bacterium]|nr:histidine phosphatase family protein [Paracoccaceae bacterium]